MCTNEKTYIAYAIYDFEQGCGCSACGYMHVYDQGGNSYKRFTNYDEAVKAAKELMVKENCDRWNVI